MIRPRAATASASRRSGGRVVILGASARAIAESAASSGWDVYAADLFGDLDLQACATVAVPGVHGTTDSPKEYPWSLLEAAAGFPAAAAWCYTGAIENHPEFIDMIARERRLAGNPSSVVKRLRDPVQVSAAAAAAGLWFPETLTSSEGVALDGSFLVKPSAGAGGRGIRPWTPDTAAERVIGQAAAHAVLPRGTRIWQRFVPGTPLSASYCFTKSSSRLLGVCRQLIGEPWCHAGLFAWCGAVTLRADGGQPAHDQVVASLTHLGDVLASRFQPVGLVGVDLVVDAAARLAVIEINPRPTASMELLERSGVGSIADGHLAACGITPPADVAITAPPPPSDSTWAKAVLFASRPTPVTQSLIDRLADETSPWSQADGGWPALSDIPRPAQTIAAGAPVVTIFAAAGTVDDALARVRDRVARIDALVAGSC